MTLDTHGLPLSTESENAAERYRDGVALTFAAWPGAAGAFDAALAADPEFALALAARARVHAMHGQPAEARRLVEAAVQAAERRGTERERSHVDVVSRVVTGQSKSALERALAHADAWPRDAVILSLPLGAFGLFAFSGMADHDQARVDLCERHAAQFDAEDWWFLTSYGWALAENGAVTRGRALLERAFGLRRANANGVHALAHVMYEGGAADEADALISGWLPDYDRRGILHGHIAWHATLSALERGDAAAALQIYADHVDLTVSQGLPINVVTDASALLWRLELYDHGAPADLWRKISDYAHAAFPRPGHAFVDSHMGLIEAATGDAPALAARVAALEGLVDQGALGAGAVVPAICRAALAFRDGDYAACVRVLEPLAADVARIGGSGAQREVFEETLLVALMRSGEADKARALLERRLSRRPTARDVRWREQLAASAAAARPQGA